MTFTQKTFAPVSSHSSNTPNLYSYKTDDTLLQVEAAGYFADKSGQIEEGDFFLVFATDGSNAFRSIGGQLFPFVAIGRQVKVEVNSTYQQLVRDDLIIGTGVFNIPLIPGSSAEKTITIRARAASTLTLVPDGTDNIEASATPVTSNTAVTLVFEIATSTWVQI